MTEEQKVFRRTEDLFVAIDTVFSSKMKHRGLTPLFHFTPTTTTKAHELNELQLIFVRQNKEGAAGDSAGFQPEADL